MTVKNALDHLILFLPVDPDTNLPKIPDFITQNFTLTPGGTHADGLTSNTLILLADGCYIELISFLPTAPPSSISSHWWSTFADFPGWADWCLTNDLTPEANYASIKDSHAEPKHGGRKRADGVDVKWAVTFPKGENGGQQNRGRVPFFCHDITPRAARVPLSEEATSHPSAVRGVRELSVVVKDQAKLEETRKVYTALFGQEGVGQVDAVVFEVGRVEQVDGLDVGSNIVLRVPRDIVEKEKVEERGFLYRDVVLGAKAGKGKVAGKRDRIDEGDDVRGLWVEYV
ncbi:hypothetical protein N0V90_007522 [Kalmusia sp. IMI 367209]|nr:hypothetical protein N0V90_007522 [Kalmusia sp. IMI 367209]